MAVLNKNDQQSNVFTMQDIHNRASDLAYERNMAYELSSFWDNVKEKQIQDTAFGMSTRNNLGKYADSFPRNKCNNEDMFNQNSRHSQPKKKRFGNEIFYDRKIKLSKIEKIFENFIPSMRDTIVSPELVISLINLHKNNEIVEAIDDTILKPGTSLVGPLLLDEENTKFGITYKLEPDELLAHFNRLDESFVQFALSNPNFRILCQSDRNELLHKNSLLFTMVSKCEYSCHKELFVIF